MRKELEACYTVGKKFGEAVQKNFTYKNKMTQFLSIIGVRNSSQELEELMRWCLEIQVAADPLLIMVVDGSEVDKKLAINQFLRGYTKGKIKE